MPADVVKSLRALTTERQALLQRERELIGSLNAVLPGIGYRVVPVTDSRPAPSLAKRTISAATARPLSCPHCGRTFGRPLHLGRHISAIHKGKGASQLQPETTTPKPRRRMSPAARRAAARRMKAYWRKRKAAERSPSRLAARSSRTRARPGRARRAKAVLRSPRRTA
jgi:hypothetical protein